MAPLSMSHKTVVNGSAGTEFSSEAQLGKGLLPGFFRLLAEFFSLNVIVFMECRGGTCFLLFLGSLAESEN